MKTQEELNALKKEVEALNAKLAELTEEELEQVTGGDISPSGAHIVENPNDVHLTVEGYPAVGGDVQR